MALQLLVVVNGVLTCIRCSLSGTCYTVCIGGLFSTGFPSLLSSRVGQFYILRAVALSGTISNHASLSHISRTETAVGVWQKTCASDTWLPKYASANCIKRCKRHLCSSSGGKDKKPELVDKG